MQGSRHDGRYKYSPTKEVANGYLSFDSLLPTIYLIVLASLIGIDWPRLEFLLEALSICPDAP